jgi:hypothetical protein
MNFSTDCSKCIFAKTIDNPSQCEFGIIDGIRTTKNIEIKNKFNYINKYVCKYGFSDSKLEELNKSLQDNTDVKEYIKSKNLISYYLVINNLENKLDITQLCNKINKLNIKPTGISIITKKNDMISAINECDSILGNKTLWRIHNFFDKDVTFGSALYTVMSTNNHFKKTNFLWILNDDQIEYMIKNKIIDAINFIVNVIQPEVGIMKSVTTNDMLGGVFLGRQNYQRLTANVAQELDSALKNIIETDNITIMEYDEN